MSSAMPPASGGRALPSPLWIIAVRQQLLCRDGRSRGIHEFFQIRFYARRRAKHQIPLRFPRETGHDIGRNRGMWEIASQAAAKRFIFRAGVMPVHAAERCITAALEGEVELWAELFTLRKPRHYLRREMIRLQGAGRTRRIPSTVQARSTASQMEREKSFP